MKIGEVAQKARVKPSTIRYYESVGLLAPPPRRAGRREYPPQAVAQLQAIAALQYAGFRLTEIRELVPVLASGRAASGRWERAARAKLKELDATIRDLQRARRTLAKAIDCACNGDPSACELVAAARLPDVRLERGARRRRSRPT